MTGKYGLVIICPICGKYKGYTSHPKCARELQKLGQEKRRNKKTTNRITDSAINYFSKTGQ